MIGSILVGNMILDAPAKAVSANVHTVQHKQVVFLDHPLGCPALFLCRLFLFPSGCFFRKLIVLSHTKIRATCR